MTYIRKFLVNEDGAVTVDMVALMAALVLIGIGIGLTVGQSTTSLAGGISTNVDARSVWAY